VQFFRIFSLEKDPAQPGDSTHLASRSIPTFETSHVAQIVICGGFGVEQIPWRGNIPCANTLHRLFSHFRRASVRCHFAREAEEN
jgi:hypothetical protein